MTKKIILYLQMKRSLRLLNKLFGDIIKNLNIPINNEAYEDVSMIQDPIIAAIEKYKRHPTILTLKS